MTASERVPQVSSRVSQSAFDGSRLRAVLLLDIRDGTQQQVLEAYEHMCNQVASIPGHISDQLCQSIENPSQWLITSEWESAPPFLNWVNSEEHLETVRPLRDCIRDTRSLRFSVLRETVSGRPAAADPAQARTQALPRMGDGVVRHALTFTVKPGSESKVAEILSGYTPPETWVDDTTRLCRTSLFMYGNRVVQAIEVRGDLYDALRHVVRQPEMRAVEEALRPHLQQERNLGDPQSTRMFFTRAALPVVHHVTSCRPEAPGARRHALYYPARNGRGTDLARLLSQQAELDADDPRSPVRASTVFQRDDTVVRLVVLEGEPDDAPDAVLGLGKAESAAVAARLLDGEALGVGESLAGEREVMRLLAHAGMQFITDRTAPDS
ncbi:MAG TPA: SchA/CurD-like domain-containing protein [Streptomyces sp.]|nr:SchA/CurD-like domain-containing protein [Streptomyces sp.]